MPRGGGSIGRSGPRPPGGRGDTFEKFVAGGRRSLSSLVRMRGGHVARSRQRALLKMDAFEDYAFDVRGFLHIKAALSEPEILRARASANDGTALDFLAQTEPAASRAALFCKGRGGGPAGGTPKLGAVPRLIDGEHNPVLRGGVGRDRSVAYFNRQGSRVVQSLRALWALDDDNSQRFVLVPCSHRSSLEAPPQCVTGEDDLGAHAMPLFFRPVLRAGDLLLYSPALLHSIEAIATSSSTSTGRLVGCEYLTNSVAPFAERADLAALKNFEGELSPMLEAILLFDQHVALTDGVRLRIEFLSETDDPSLWIEFMKIFHSGREESSGSGGRVID